MKNTELDFDWSCLPKWAKYIAMDKDGKWCWYEVEPVPFMDVWICGDSYYGGIPQEFCPKNFTGDWEESLFKVPIANSKIDYKSLRTNFTKELHSFSKEDLERWKEQDENNTAP